MKRAWLALTIALALHVADEAWNDFLGFYNPFVMMLRDVLLWQWLLAWLALPYGLLLTLNGVAHIGGSLYTRRMLPGTISAPLLTGCAVWLIKSAVSRLRS